METILLLAVLGGGLYALVQWTDLVFVVGGISFLLGCVLAWMIGPDSEAGEPWISLMLFGGGWIAIAAFVIGAVRGAFNIVDNITQPRQQNHYHDNRHLNVYYRED